MSENTVNAQIGEKIRTLRHMNGMNQTDLGKKIGVTFQQIQKYEKGYNNIVASKLYELACKMDVDIAYFFENILEFDSKHIELIPLDSYLKDNYHAVKNYRLFKIKKTENG